MEKHSKIIDVNVQFKICLFTIFFFAIHFIVIDLGFVDKIFYLSFYGIYYIVITLLFLWLHRVISSRYVYSTSFSLRNYLLAKRLIFILQLVFTFLQFTISLIAYLFIKGTDLNHAKNYMIIFSIYPAFLFFIYNRQLKEHGHLISKQ